MRCRASAPLAKSIHGQAKRMPYKSDGARVLDSGANAVVCAVLSAEIKATGDSAEDSGRYSAMTHKLR